MTYQLKLKSFLLKQKYPPALIDDSIKTTKSLNRLEFITVRYFKALKIHY